MGKYILIILGITLIIPQLYYFLKEITYKDLKNGTRYFVKETKVLEENQSRVILTNTDGFDISLNVFNIENPKAIVQIVHGVYEHSANYFNFIKYLNDKGYAVIAADNRGHGRSVSENYPSGYIKYLGEVIDDQHVVNKFARILYKNKPIYMLGHSFGSMIARLYLKDHDETIDKLVITGTVAYNPMSILGVYLGNIITFFLGEYKKSKLLDKLTGVADPDISWISYSKENIEMKKSDPLRLHGFLARANVVLILANKRLHQFSKYKVKNKNLPIISITGEDDKVVNGDKGLKDSMDTLKQIGYKNVNFKVYKNMKHEVLFEDEKELVYQDIINFFEN
ncbi:MAG: alpha/beta fold hydrolase [Anaerococcus sp.]